MRSLKTLLCTTVAYLGTTLAANAQAVNTLTVQPFQAGNPTLYAAGILSINLPSFYNGTNEFAGGIDLGRGTAPEAVNGRVQVFNRRSILGYQYSTNTSDYTQTEPVVTLTNLASSSNVRAGSTGLVVNNVGNQLTSVGFQFSPLSTTTGLATSDLTNTPYLVVADGVTGTPGRVRYFPVTAGTFIPNIALNQYNGLNLPNQTTGSVQQRTPVLNNAFYSVTFNSAQLGGIQGNLRRVGLVTFGQGVTLVTNVSVNGTTADTFVVNTINGFPF